MYLNVMLPGNLTFNSHLIIELEPKKFHSDNNFIHYISLKFWTLTFPNIWSFKNRRTLTWFIWLLTYILLERWTPFAGRFLLPVNNEIHGWDRVSNFINAITRVEVSTSLANLKEARLQTSILQATRVV